MTEKEEVVAQGLMKEVYDRGINIYMLINKTKKELKRVDHFPNSVIIEVCKEYISRLDQGQINKTYPYFLRLLKAKSAEWHANNQIKEHEKHKKEPPIAESVKDILGRIFK